MKSVIKYCGTGVVESEMSIHISSFSGMVGRGDKSSAAAFVALMMAVEDRSRAMLGRWEIRRDPFECLDQYAQQC